VHPNVLLPSLTAVLGFVFAAILARRFLVRRQPYVGVWVIGLVLYALAAGTEALGGAVGWTPGLYRAWYITGAIGVAAFLGAGTVYLHRAPSFGSLTIVCLLVGSVPALAGGHREIGLLVLGAAVALTALLTWRPRVFGHAVFVVLLLGGLVAARAVLGADVDVRLLPSGADEVVSGQAFDAQTRALTPPFNIAGALVLVAGALTSALYFWRTRSDPRRVASNVLIAVGAFVPSIASGVTRFGITSVFFLGELLGLACILAGFLLSSTPARPTPDPSASGGPS
jgi:hypothetical protein